MRPAFIWAVNFSSVLTAMTQASTGHNTIWVGQDTTWKGDTGFEEGRRRSVPEFTARSCSCNLLWRDHKIKWSQYEWIWSQQWHKKHQLEIWGFTGTKTGKVEGQLVRKKTQNQQVRRRFTGWLSLMFDDRVPVNPGKCPTRTRVFALFHSFKLGPAKQLIKEPLCPVISGNYAQI